MTGPRILTLDIETSPIVAHVWGLRNQNIALTQLREASRVICWAAKWHGSKKVEFASEFHNSRAEMIDKAHELMSAADVLVHYNGNSFDVPKLNTEFAVAGLSPPQPSQNVDLYRVVRKQFKFTSNKLDYVLGQFGLGSKVKHEGHMMWVRCMEGDAKAWSDMRRYCKGDVVKEEQLFDRLIPWIPAHPNNGLWSGEKAGCPRCGSSNVQKRGFAYTAQSVFQQHACMDCGGWFRGTKSISRMETRATV